MRSKSNQQKSIQQLLSKEFKAQKEFGGSLLKKSHAKKARPITTKQAMHVTLRSSKARGAKSFLASRKRAMFIDGKVQSLAKKYGIKIYKYANVGNHLHLLVRASYRRGFIAFLRAISGVIARIALGKERGRARMGNNKGQPDKDTTGFWDQRPWTRILNWATDFYNVKKYVELNFAEAMGFVAYTPRKFNSTA